MPSTTETFLPYFKQISKYITHTTCSTSCQLTPFQLFNRQLVPSINCNVLNSHWMLCVRCVHEVVEQR